MVGILLLTHGTFGASLLQTALHVLNRPLPLLQQMGLNAEDDPLQLLPRARQLAAALDDGGGVLILTDMYGASPSNLAAKLVVPGKVAAVAGVNLPMLIRALTYQDKPLALMVSKAISGGCEGVLQIPTLTPAPSPHHAATGH